MDPITAAGLALSVVNLVPLCAAGLQMIENCIEAPKDAIRAFDFIRIQSGVCRYSISYLSCIALTGADLYWFVFAPSLDLIFNRY
jgi:hypothetical protein